MKYNLSNPLHRRQLAERTEFLLKKAQGFCELTEIKPKRTLRQNAYLHAILAYFATQYGENTDYVKQYIFKRFANPDLFIRDKQDPLIGNVKILRSTRDLTTEELTIAIDRFRTWASKEAGIYLPSAEEQQYLAYMETEIDRNRQYT